MITSGRWLNQNGGGLEILSTQGRRFEGRYQTKVGSPDPDDWFDVVGMTDGTLIGFTVLWENSAKHHQSLTSWAGRFYPAGDTQGLGNSSRDRIEFQWHLARLTKGDDHSVPTQYWEMFLTNCGVLYRHE